MKLGTQVGLGPGHIWLDGDLAVSCPSPKGAQPQIFGLYICCGQMAGWIKMPLGTEIGIGTCDFVFRLSIHALVAKIELDKVVRWCADGDF